MVQERVKYKVISCDEEYAKKKELNKEDIIHLMEWSHKQPHLPDTTELQCIRYYNCNDFSLQKTKEFIEVHFTFRHEFQEIFNGRDFGPSDHENSIWNIIYVHKCDKLTPKGHTVIYAGLKDSDAKKFDWEIATSAFHKVIVASALEGISDGYEFVLDMEGLKFEHVRMLTIPYIRKLLTYVQDALEVKMKGVHVVRINALLDKILFLAKPFIRKELWDMLHFHSDIDKFFSMIPKECNTKDLNGSLSLTRDELNEVTLTRLNDFKEDIVADLEMKTKEDKRPNGVGKAPCLTASFKKLDID